MGDSAIWQVLTDPLQFSFMQRGVIEVLLLGLICGAIGAFVVTRGLGFIGDAISHSIFHDYINLWAYKMRMPHHLAHHWTTK